MPAPSGYLLAGRYRLLDPVGRGGMGTVWRAHDELLDRDVAVKEVRLPHTLDEDLRAELCVRTEREAKASARISHPSVVTVFDVVTEDDRPWIVMELLNAVSLEDVAKEEGPLSPKRAAEIGRQIIGALSAAHMRGILHRDVKPSNVLLADDDRAILTDFGIARLEGDTEITQIGMVLGSAGYIAPERAFGSPATPASDLWALGATLYTVVEGHGRNGRRAAMAALAALLSDEAIPMHNAGPLRPVLEGLLRKIPEDRLRAEPAARMLARVAAGQDALPEDRPATTPPPPRRTAVGSHAKPTGRNGRHERPSAPRPPAPRRTVATIGLIAAGLLLAALAIAKLGAGRTSEQPRPPPRGPIPRSLDWPAGIPSGDRPVLTPLVYLSSHGRSAARGTL